MAIKSGLGTLRHLTEEILIEAFGGRRKVWEAFGLDDVGKPQQSPQAPPQLQPGTPFHDRLQAVMSIHPPPITDGEVRCTTPGCKSEGKLSRNDRQCWWCGGEEFEIVTEELKVWMRIPEAPKKVVEEPLDHPLLGPPGMGCFSGQTYQRLKSGVASAPSAPADPTALALAHLTIMVAELQAHLNYVGRQVEAAATAATSKVIAAPQPASAPGWGTFAKARSKAEADARRKYDEAQERKARLQEQWMRGLSWYESP